MWLEKLKLIVGRIENIVEKRENAGYSLSHNDFKRFFIQGYLKSGLCGKGLNKTEC